MIIDFVDNSISFRQFISALKGQPPSQEIPDCLKKRVSIPASSEMMVDLSIGELRLGIYFMKSQKINNAISANG